MEKAVRGAMDPGMTATTKVMPHSATTRLTSKQQPVSAAQIWLLLRRLMVLVAAGLYVQVSIHGGIQTLQELHGVMDHSITYQPETSALIAPYAGTSRIGDSKLIKDIGGPAPRNDTIYLLSSSSISNVSCVKTPKYDAWMYGNQFLRAQYAELARDTSYNITLFKTSELIAPVVDCSSHMLTSGTSMYMRVYYLLRDKTDPSLVSLVTYSHSIQDYRFPDQYQTGVAGVVVLSVVTDMRFSEVDAYYYAMTLGYPFRKASYSAYELRNETADGYRVFESILPVGSTDVTRVIYTSWRRGMYNNNAETEQFNVRNLNWLYRTDPIKAMGEWEWSGVSVVKDSWTWMHVMHFVFAADMLFNLMVLMLVIYRNMRKGKFWIGDAFISFSRSVMFRGVLVLLGWYLNGFWTLMEFCIQDGKIVSNPPKMFIYGEIMHADLMVIFLSLAGLLGFVVRERIDPALSVFLFECCYHNRHTITRLFPTILQTVADHSIEDVNEGLMPVPAKLASITPMRFRTTHPIRSQPPLFVLACLSPILLTFCLLLVYAPLRKIHRHFFPDRMVQLSRGTNMSTESEAILAWKQTLTMFEVATGAALQNRVGLVSDYDNCVYIKGLKFASADGIYCNGYVVANSKWLMRTSDLPLILGMVVTRVRFADVYVYEVDTYTVQKNARLFYPEMMTFTELFQLNTMILA